MSEKKRRGRDSKRSPRPSPAGAGTKKGPRQPPEERRPEATKPEPKTRLKFERVQGDEE